MIDWSLVNGYNGSKVDWLIIQVCNHIYDKATALKMCSRSKGKYHARKVLKTKQIIAGCVFHYFSYYLILIEVIYNFFSFFSITLSTTFLIYFNRHLYNVFEGLVNNYNFYDIRKCIYSRQAPLAYWFLTDFYWFFSSCRGFKWLSTTCPTLLMSLKWKRVLLTVLWFILSPELSFFFSFFVSFF